MNREDALKKSDEAIASLIEELEAGKSESLIRYLDTMSSFHNYSFSNCMLIATQNPNATNVAGFSSWKTLGRFVKKGEKGIGILAPLIGKKKDAEQSQDNEKVVFGFRVVHVFDVSQTEGDDLAELDFSIKGDVGEKLDCLERIVCNHGIELTYEPESVLGNSLGVSKGGQIAVLDTLNPASRFSTLVHELAHELLHRGDRRAKTTKVIRETEAESVAYIVCKYADLDCGSKAADYIQLYTGDAKLLMQSLECVRRVSSSVISKLEKPIEMEEKIAS